MWDAKEFRQTFDESRKRIDELEGYL